MNEKLNYILDWMDDNFNGDLEELKTKAFKKTVEEDIANELWNEIGENVLKDMYRLRRIIPRRNRFIKNSSDSRNQKYKYNGEWKNLDDMTDEEKKAVFDKMSENQKTAIYDKKVKIYKVNGKWVDILDMTKEECVMVADNYDKKAKSCAFERDFLNGIADNLKNGQAVKEVFTIDEIRNLREKDDDRKLKVV